jgi:hypothetical protein
MIELQSMRNMSHESKPDVVISLVVQVENLHWQGDGRDGSAELELTLYRQVVHEPFLALGMVKDLLKRRVLQGGPVDIPRHPVVVEDRGSLRGAGDKGKK